MLTISGRKTRCCDGLSRRGFLSIGGLTAGAFGAVTLADLMRAEAAAPEKKSDKAIINIFLGGGPPHQDMWEIKTEAPAEIRGEFAPIPTAVPGIQIGECFPKIASMMDRMAVIRSVVGCSGGHDAFQCFSGWNRSSLSSIGGRPSIGSVLSKVQGPTHPSVPSTVALAAKTSHTPWSEPGAPGFLGASHQAFRPNGGGMENLTLNGVTLERLNDREQLLTSLDGLKRNADATGMMDGMDAFSQAAFGVLTSSKLADALDVTKESEEVRARYGDGKPYKYQYDGAPTCNDHLLLARRLVEAGVRSVTLSFGRWDSHGANFDLVRDHGGKLDQAVSALVQDLDERGMLDDVTVLVWGEFGRTPRINKNAGRDHWPQVSCCLLAGGGMKTGQAIGSTNRLGERAVERPVDMQEIVGTAYYNLGLDPMTTTIMDPTGRPQYLVDRREPIKELV
ncbi:MAG TPA: DUF1501 domain-containing protein [Planctomycetaceae bacterium]|nr:DUF1501 domain-containing protein [Planctomycetaceae bacterium]